MKLDKDMVTTARGSKIQFERQSFESIEEAVATIGSDKVLGWLNYAFSLYQRNEVRNSHAEKRKF